MFQPNKKFQKEYDRIWKENPESANLFLLLAELADKKGLVENDSEELASLFDTRFNDPGEYAL